MSENINEISDSEFAAATASGLVLVDFWAPWCGPCQMMGPVLEEVAAEAAFAKVCKVNVDDNNEQAAKYGVQSIPTLIIFKDGKEVEKMIGALSADDLLDKLSAHK